ncbi:MAG: cyclodeaminase/cyclohydrolase family protein [Gammaproteobacteria bacterium]|nr:methenyltetrahydrofolate cyclohydrolase [Gammaproteobacteria bacterium]NIN62229.1 methenyltetrahydrofolate cyclohydrolase [Gammaproteobacteria bacterium]NIO62240.1 methenyltetrahydrofolate cyclohydrolase [Gammaproteobacteria bacterium]NIP48760.1 cyclodeaminase/cyclohydrolase family protein [Gammaproteobacteria bacterium]NIQ09214.1 cyclodeaminase/cyclohydrolase family protein [Gammaproteobacteria bacterium]
MIKDKSVQVFLDELASKASTPGGGSAAAIIGAMGAALISMVANFTVGKKGYEDADADARDILQHSEDLRDQLTGMIKADVDVFNRVMAAYGMPKETDEEKAARSEEIQAALKEATDVPLACAHASAEVIKLCQPIAEKGNKNVISDAGVAVLAGQAALRSAALNVYINIGGIKDAAFRSDRQKQLEDILAGMDALTEDVYELVKSKL